MTCPQYKKGTVMLKYQELYSWIGTALPRKIYIHASFQGKIEKTVWCNFFTSDRVEDKRLERNYRTKVLIATAFPFLITYTVDLR